MSNQIKRKSLGGGRAHRRTYILVYLTVRLYDRANDMGLYKLHV